MQNARTVIAVLLVMTLIFFWGPITNWFGSQMGWDMTPHPLTESSSTTQPSTQEASTTQPAPTTQQALAQPPATAPASAPAMTVGPTLRVMPATQPIATATLGSAKPDDPDYHMAISLVPQGAGIDSVVLNQFKKEAENDERFEYQQPYAGDEASSRPFATRTVVIDGKSADLTSAQWALENATPDTATYGVTLEGDSGPLVRIHKTYQLLPIKSDPSQGYEIVFSQRFENLTDKPLTVRTTYNGPTMPPRESDRGGDRQTLAGFDNQKGAITVGHDMIESFSKDKPTREYAQNDDKHPMVWAGAGSIYFLAIVHPFPLENGQVDPKYIGQVTARVLNPEARGDEHEIQMTFATADLNVAPHQTLDLPSRVFFGPKQRKLLNDDYYSKFPLSYNDTLVLSQGMCAICTFQWLVNILVVLLRGFWWIWGGFAAHGDWGLAIISLVVLVRVILHPITKRSQISMSKMSKMGPEMERLKKKYGEDKEAMGKAQMELMKEQGIAPMLGCLPMFLQMPIWVALWQALQSTFELRQAPFLWGLTWIHDLSKPDHLITWTPISLPFGFQLSGLNLLPILMGVVFYFQTKLQPKPAAMTPEQASQQKMMTWMTVALFPLMLYNGPSGLNLYILTSTFIGIFESKIVRDHIKQREEEEKARREIVEAKPTRGAKMSKRDDRDDRSTKPRGLMGWLADLQDRAEQVRREAQKKGGK